MHLADFVGLSCATLGNVTNLLRMLLPTSPWENHSPASLGLLLIWLPRSTEAQDIPARQIGGH